MFLVTSWQYNKLSITLEVIMINVLANSTYIHVQQTQSNISTSSELCPSVIFTLVLALLWSPLHPEGKKISLLS